MGWLGGQNGPASESAEAEAEERSSGPAERSAPGVSALLDGVDEDGTHAVLDLGAAADSSLRVYSRYARRLRFADLLAARSREGLASALDVIPDTPERPYDLIFAWDVLDRLSRAERIRLMERLIEASAPDARLHMIVRGADGEGERLRFRFALLDTDRMRCEAQGTARPAGRRLLPVEVEDLLEPFTVIRGFTLKGGLREYVAARREEPPDRIR